MRGLRIRVWLASRPSARSEAATGGIRRLRSLGRRLCSSSLRRTCSIPMLQANVSRRNGTKLQGSSGRLDRMSGRLRLPGLGILCFGSEGRENVMSCMAMCVCVCVCTSYNVHCCIYESCPFLLVPLCKYIPAICYIYIHVYARAHTHTVNPKP